MSYNVITLHSFDKQAKRLIKKYPSLKTELIELINLLKEDPKQGSSLGSNCFKVRLSISSKGRGKSGGGRVITHSLFRKHGNIIEFIRQSRTKQYIRYCY